MSVVATSHDAAGTRHRVHSHAGPHSGLCLCSTSVNVSLGCAVNAPLRSQPATTETAATAVCLFTENNKKSIKHVCDCSVSCLSCSTDSSQNVQQLLKISLENSYLLGTPRTHARTQARTHTHTHTHTLSDSIEFIGAIQMNLSIYLSIYLHTHNHLMALCPGLPG